MSADPPTPILSPEEWNSQTYRVYRATDWNRYKDAVNPLREHDRALRDAPTVLTEQLNHADAYGVEMRTAAQTWRESSREGWARAEGAEDQVAVLTEENERLQGVILQLTAETASQGVTIAVLTEERDGFERSWHAEGELADALRDRVAVLEAGLRRYGVHEPGCSLTTFDPGEPCDCGLDGALGGVPATKEEQT